MAGTGGMVGGSGLEDDLKRSNIVRLRGLPFSASENDVREFFKGLELGPDGVVIQINYQGKSTGQAFVQFANSEQANRALERNRQHIGSRYIEVFKGHAADMQSSLRLVGRSSSSSAPPPTSSSPSPGPSSFSAPAASPSALSSLPGSGGSSDARYTGVVRMRGMPFSCTVADIIAFFKGLQIAPDGIFLTTHADGRPTGEAYVEFSNEETTARAMQLHREPMGSRYVELFRSTKGEMMTAVQQKLYGGSLYPGGGGYGGAHVGLGQLGYPVGAIAGVIPGSIPAPDAHDNVCIKMRGLPYNAGTREVLEFFQGYRVAPQGVHVVVGPNERPTGEAYVEFVTAEEAGRAMERHRKNIGSRYIELFRATKSEALIAIGGGYNVAAAMDPNVQLLLLQQQQQQQQFMAMGISGNLPGSWGIPDSQSAQAAAMYQRQSTGGYSNRHQ